MFRGCSRGWADLVLPGTSYLERDGTYVNLEGRLQRLRRAVIPPCPDELAWIAKLAERFDVEVSPHAVDRLRRALRRCYGGIAFGEVGERAALPAERARGVPPLPTPPETRATARRPAARRATGRSSPAPRSSASPSSSSSGPAPRSSSRAPTRARAASRPATRVPRQLERHVASSCARASNATLAAGRRARRRRSTPAGLHESSRCAA